jgi:hypothetical protein
MVATFDLAIDKTLGKGFTGTLEATFTKDINALVIRNSNLKPADSVYYEGDYTRPRYTSSYNKYYNGSFSTYTLENTNKGYSATFTAMVSKMPTKGFYGNVAYVYTIAKSVSGLASAQANSLWTYNPTFGTGNSVELGNSPYFVPHRVMANLSYRLEYAGHMASTFSFYYSGSKDGSLTYSVYNDINNDGKSYDLMYIPKNENEMSFQSNTVTVTQPDGVTKVSTTFTAGQQKEAFEEFINNSPYLKKHRGQMAQRNAAFFPWYNKLDFAFLQDFYIKAGNHTHTLQLSATINNFLNMLNKNWGVYQGYTTTSPLTFKSFDANAKPIYTWQTYNTSIDGGKSISPLLHTKPFQDSRTVSSTWQLQFGLRYTF